MARVHTKRASACLAAGAAGFVCEDAFARRCRGPASAGGDADGQVPLLGARCHRQPRGRCLARSATHTPARTSSLNDAERTARIAQRLLGACRHQLAIDPRRRGRRQWRALLLLLTSAGGGRRHSSSRVVGGCAAGGAAQLCSHGWSFILAAATAAATGGGGQPPPAAVKEEPPLLVGEEGSMMATLDSFLLPPDACRMRPRCCVSMTDAASSY